jgi:hypothetical protein
MARYPSETDTILLAIAKERQAFCRLASAARACADPTAKRHYNQLALDHLKSLSALVSAMDGLADDWFTHLDLTFPWPQFPNPLAHVNEGVARSTMADEKPPQTFSGPLARGVKQEELLALLESLRVEEENHRARLVSLLSWLEADRPVVAKERSPRFMRPAGHRD